MKNFGTYNGKPITEDMLDSYSVEFERDWQTDEISVVPTERGKALLALQALNLPVSEIEALERRAKHENKPLNFYLRTVLQDALAG